MQGRTPPLAFDMSPSAYFIMLWNDPILTPALELHQRCSLAMPASSLKAGRDGNTASELSSCRALDVVFPAPSFQS